MYDSFADILKTIMVALGILFPFLGALYTYRLEDRRHERNPLGDATGMIATGLQRSEGIAAQIEAMDRQTLALKAVALAIDSASHALERSERLADERDRTAARAAEQLSLVRQAIEEAVRGMRRA